MKFGEAPQFLCKTRWIACVCLVCFWSLGCRPVAKVPGSPSNSELMQVVNTGVADDKLVAAFGGDHPKPNPVAEGAILDGIAPAELRGLLEELLASRVFTADVFKAFRVCPSYPCFLREMGGSTDSLSPDHGPLHTAYGKLRAIAASPNFGNAAQQVGEYSTEPADVGRSGLGSDSMVITGLVAVSFAQLCIEPAVRAQWDHKWLEILGQDALGKVDGGCGVVTANGWAGKGAGLLGGIIDAFP